MDPQHRPLILVAARTGEGGAALARDLDPKFAVISAWSFEAALDILDGVRLDAVLAEALLGAYEPPGLDLLRFAEWAQPGALRVLIAAEPPARAFDHVHFMVKAPWPADLASQLDPLVRDPVARAAANLRSRCS